MTPHGRCRPPVQRVRAPLRISFEQSAAQQGTVWLGRVVLGIRRIGRLQLGIRRLARRLLVTLPLIATIATTPATAGTAIAAPATAEIASASTASASTASASTASASTAAASGDDDTAALALQGANPVDSPAHRSLAVTGEAAATVADLHGGGTVDAERLSLEVSEDLRLAPAWRFVFGDRLDADFSGSWDSLQKINTLKQAYVSWQPQADWLVDLGRVNARQGVAFGYNPTDFFRADALRTIESLDPDSLRDERLGTAMLRGETLWNGGALTAVYAPKLARAPSDAAFSPDLGATNAEGRWLLSLTERLTPGWSPQWLLFGTDAGAPQLGLNTTALLGDATVAYLEASGGRSPSLWTQAENLPADPALRLRAAAGLTYSTTNKMALTLEFEYDGAALSARRWNAARMGDPQAYGLYRDYVSAQQELATTQALFAYVSWQDVGIRHLDWGAFLRLDLIDHSRLPWTELRYHWTKLDLALRWQDDIGGRTSDYGATATGQTWQLVADYYW